MQFTRAKFEELNMDSFNKCVQTVEACLSDAKMEKSDVNNVILVGGSTRIPKVQCMLQEFFERKKLCMSLNPDEAVAYGAAVMAAKLSGNNHKSCRDLLLLDVTPLSLGVQVKGEVFNVVIPRNTLIPTKKSKKFSTTKDDQSSAHIKVYQDERARSTDNHLLGKFKISGIPPSPKGDAKLELCFEIDVNGILTVNDKISKEKLTVTKENGRLSTEQIERMIEDAKKYKQEDEEYEKKVDALNALMDCIYNMDDRIKSMRRGRGRRRLRKMEDAIVDTTKWIEQNKAASVDEVQRMKEHLESIYMDEF
ncbi:unnamed protein product [Lactuca virosa]|uniref:Heat shock protein 70 n=1 Tax=Lactuca virosa TaxID=75947 RepID=A0AAU9P791_9ASTR|nr:unnamed protein product [Lactuca virosa]